MSQIQQLKDELQGLHEDISELYEIWDELIAKTDENGDILIPEDVGLRISVLLGV